MNIVFDENSGLIIHGEWIGLETILPVMNGNIIQNFQISRISQGENAFALLYTSPEIGDAVFTLEIVPEGQERCRIRFHLKNFTKDINSFGIYISKIQNLRLFLRSGFTSWDGSSYEEPENLARIPGNSNYLINSYSMTQLIPRFGTGSMVLGFDRHDRFQQVFSFEVGKIPVSIKILTMWDQKEINLESTCTSEWLEIYDHNEIENALQIWAKIVADKAPIKPRINGFPISGWCSKNNLSGFISEDNILYHLHSLKKVSHKIKSSLKVFQIDDGFTSEMGDWLDTKPQFPNGMKPVLSAVKEAGFIPGLWIAPFLVGNQSKLFQEHPDWVLHDRNTGKPLVQKLFGKIRWCKRSDQYFILDGTHPGAFEYLRMVFRTWKQEWGCEYFKTDFMDFGSLYGSDEVTYYKSGKTRIEVWRDIAEMIRREIGDALWAGSRCPLWASIGLVDAIKISDDMGVVWDDEFKIGSLLKNLAGRNFANHILWQTDADCIPLGKNYHFFSNSEINSIAIFLGMSGGVMMTSEDFAEVEDSRIDLWNLIVGSNRKKTRQPFLGTSSVIYTGARKSGSNDFEHEIIGQDLDPVLVQIRDGTHIDGPHAVFILNKGDFPVQRSIPIENLGLMGPLYIYEWDNFMPSDNTRWHLQVTLAPHEGKLFFICKNMLTELPNVLP